jgi:hypothetical protein
VVNVADFDYEEYLNNFILSKFGYLEGRVIVSNDEEIIVTKELICKAVRKLVGYRRNSYKDQLSRKATAHEVIEHIDPKTGQNIITEQDVLNNIPGVTGLKIGGNKPKEIEVKFDDVRNMDLSLSNWDTYQPAEKDFAQERLHSYQEFYSLDAPNDILGIYDVIDLEVRMQTIRLFIRLSKKKDEIAEYDIKLKELRQQWSKTLEDLNLKKKQRDTAKTKTVDNTSEEYINIIKSVDEMQAEIEKRKLEIQNKKQLKRKRNK